MPVSNLRDPQVTAEILATAGISEQKLSRAASLMAKATPAERDKLGQVCYRYRLVNRWREHKVIYRLDPELVDALRETESVGNVPCEVFTRLPHPNPYAVFEQPIPIQPAAMNWLVRRAANIFTVWCGRMGCASRAVGFTGW